MTPPPEEPPARFFNVRRRNHQPTAHMIVFLWSRMA